MSSLLADGARNRDEAGAVAGEFQIAAGESERVRDVERPGAVLANRRATPMVLSKRNAFDPVAAMVLVPSVAFKMTRVTRWRSPVAVRFKLLVAV